MSRLFGIAKRYSFPFSYSQISYSYLNAAYSFSTQLGHFMYSSRPCSTVRSPFDANILRIIHNKIEHFSYVAPPNQPATKFSSFTVQDQPGQQWVRLKGRFDDVEDIEMEVTMFDGYGIGPIAGGGDSSVEDVRLHITLLVDISKGTDDDALEFACSAWPESLEIQRVYLLKNQKVLDRPYMGPDFRKLSIELQKTLRDFLEARGINNELSVFLHEYMMNKNRIEQLHWCEKVKSFVEE
ncbi:hypothetical protein K2173_025883 [Erythroxylum novogranatense]|uniref:Mitochondrial glycoprotein n=1 Tax=Erythroxylum novogranatense TaxID=1862640 RepID=A0AAV8SHL2_9ROSI|nr:hypothetical protein K2173_025883 [Erythroxylum novogranatense]